MTKVRFVFCKNIPDFGLFNPWDVVSLPDKLAQQLIDAKAAVPADEPAAPPPVKAEPRVVERTIRDDLEISDESEEV